MKWKKLSDGKKVVRAYQVEARTVISLPTGVKTAQANDWIVRDGRRIYVEKDISRFREIK